MPARYNTQFDCGTNRKPTTDIKPKETGKDKREEKRKTGTRSISSTHSMVQ
jgi:hypothetical protein